MPLYIEQSGDLDTCHGCLTTGLTLKDRATQPLIDIRVVLSKIGTARHPLIKLISNILSIKDIV